MSTPKPKNNLTSEMDSKTEGNNRQSNTKIQSENQDYYIENGFYVFTAHFHLKRGTCCGNKCRHCPYDHINVK